MIRKICQNRKVVAAVGMLLTAGSFSTVRADQAEFQKLQNATGRSCLDGVVLRDDALKLEEKRSLCEVLRATVKDWDAINYVEFIAGFPDKNIDLMIASLWLDAGNVETVFVEKNKSSFVVRNHKKTDYADFVPGGSEILKADGIYQVESTTDHDSAISPRSLFRLNKDYTRTEVGDSFDYSADVYDQEENSKVKLVLKKNPRTHNLQLVFAGDYKKIDTDIGALPAGESDRYMKKYGRDVTAELVNNKWKIVSGEKIKE